MEAPDKIYLDEDMIRYHVLNEKLNESDIEYIRKDALLEWAKKEYLSLRNGTKADQIKSSAFFEVVKHIESL